MIELWQKIRKALEPPSHPIQFNKTQPMDHLVNELIDAKKAWDGEQTTEAEPTTSLGESFISQSPFSLPGERHVSHSANQHPH